VVLASRFSESNGLRANIRVTARPFTLASACAHADQASSSMAVSFVCTAFQNFRVSVPIT
jgi:hypothetical protein